MNISNRSVELIVAVLVGLAVLSSQGNAATIISPGRVRAFASTDAVDLSTSPTVGVRINKASHHYVVVVETTVVVQTSGAEAIVVQPTVNGVGVEGAPGTSVCISTNCTISGTWFLDIDAAEAAYPGNFFVGPTHTPLPLDVALNLQTVGYSSAKIVLVARKENKNR